MCNGEWPKNRVIVEVAGISGKCPVYKKGDVMVINEPAIVMKETDAVCVRSLGPLMTHLISAAAGIDPSTAPGGIAWRPGLAIPPEKGVHYTTCPMPGPPHTEMGNVMFRIKLEGIAEKESKEKKRL